jgi:hypothetical protein
MPASKANNGNNKLRMAWDSTSIDELVDCAECAAGEYWNKLLRSISINVIDKALSVKIIHERKN